MYVCISVGLYVCMYCFRRQHTTAQHRPAQRRWNARSPVPDWARRSRGHGGQPTAAAPALNHRLLLAANATHPLTHSLTPAVKTCTMKHPSLARRSPQLIGCLPRAALCGAWHASAKRTKFAAKKKEKDHGRPPPKATLQNSVISTPPPRAHAGGRYGALQCALQKVSTFSATRRPCRASSGRR